MGRGELAAARGGAGLIEQRRALRRGFAEMDRIEPEIAALMPDAMHLPRLCKHAPRAVAHDRPVLPAALPQLIDDFHVFFGDLVAGVVLALALQPDALGGAVQISGDDVPADAPAGQVIKRRKPARQYIGMLVRDRAGHAEAEIPG